MLTYKLTGTTEESGSPRRTPTSVDPNHRSPPRPHRIFAPRCAATGAELLTCNFSSVGLTGFEAATLARRDGLADTCSNMREPVLTWTNTAYQSPVVLLVLARD